MRKQNSLKLLLCILLTCLGVSAWGTEAVAYTLTPAAGSNSSYAGNCDITISNIKWNVTGNSQMTPWRIGGKSITSVDRNIYSKTAIADNISSVVVTNGTASGITVNSFTLIVASDADFSNVISTVTGTFKASGTTTFTRPDGADWTGRYYKFTYNVTVSSSKSNGYVQFSSAVFNKETTKTVTKTAFENDTYTAYVGQSFTSPKAKVTKEDETEISGLTVKYSGGTEGIATVTEAGEVTIVGPGTTTIKANFEGNDDYVESSDSYTLTVVKPFAGTFTKFTGSDILEGDYLVCVDANAMKNEVSSNRLLFEGVTVSDNSVTNPSVNLVWHIAPSETEGYVTMYNAEVTKYAASTGGKNAAQLLASDTEGKILWSVTSPSAGTYNFLNKYNNDNGVNAKLQKNGEYGFACYGSYSAITLYMKEVKSAITKATCEHGSVSVSGASDLNNVVAGSTITLGNTPADGYKLSSYSVYATGDATKTVDVNEDNGVYTFTMPAYAVTVSATFEVAKALDGTKLTLEGDYPTVFWKGDTFNHEGLVVKAKFTTGLETVTDNLTFSEPDMTQVGIQTITVTYTEGAASQTATYDIEVKTIANTQATAYTTAQAIALIDAGKDLSTQVYVKGTISKVASFNSTYGSITYWLDNDAFEIYSGLNNNGEQFASIDDIKVDGEAVVYGTIKKYVSSTTTYEMDKSNWLVSYTAPAIERTTATLTLGSHNTSIRVGGSDSFTATYNGDGTLKASSSDEAVAKASVANGTVTVTPIAAGGPVTIKVYAEQTDNYTAVEKSYSLTVLEALQPASLPFSFDGGVADVATTTGMNQSGLGTDYKSSPKLKFGSQDAELVVYYGANANTLSYKIQGNSFSGGTFDVMESADGSDYTAVKSYTSFGSSATEESCTLNTASRYVKFVYTTKSAGNVALGAISISYEKADPQFAFENETYSFTTTEDKTVKATSAAGSTGKVTYSTTEDASVFLIDENTGDIVCETVGTYSVSASIEATDDYAAKTVSATVKVVVPKTYSNVALVAKYGDKYYAMDTTFQAVEVLVKEDGKVYAPATITDVITWKKGEDGSTTSFQNAYGKYLNYSSSNLLLSTSELGWSKDAENDTWYTTVKTTNRSFVYREGYGFKNYAISNVGSTGYGDYAHAYEIVVLEVGAQSAEAGAQAWTATAYSTSVATGKYATLCLPYNADVEGAQLYTMAGKTLSDDGSVASVSFDEVADNKVVGGVPYLFQATADAQTFTKTGTDAAAIAPVANNKGYTGTYTSVDLPANDGYYFLSNKNNAQTFALAGNNIHVGAFKCYISNFAYAETLDPAAQNAPGRITLGELVMPGIQTGLDQLSAQGENEKFFLNGQLYIRHNGQLFNAKGQLIK